jgi:hypothetical protein
MNALRYGRTKGVVVRVAHLTSTPMMAGLPS